MLATPLYAIDAPDGSGKVPVPLDFWQCDIGQYTDFDGKKLRPVNGC